MPYAERVGESKLRLLRDGVRFFLAIGDAVLLYHPSRVFGLGILFSVMAGALMGMYPIEFYLRNHRLEEWMIYRLLLCGFLLSRKRSWVVAAASVTAAVALVWPALRQYVETGHITVHWSRPLAAVFLLQVALVAVIHTVMRQFVDLWKGQLSHRLRSERD